MKMRSCGFLFLVVVLGLSLSFCGCCQKAMKKEAPPPLQKQEAVVPPPAPAPAPAPVPPPPGPAAVLQPIYFDLNKSVITPDAAETLKANLEWFRQNPDKKVRIEGNCDPRATKKYNHALGQRRADATKKYLAGLGVKAGLLETVSYGKDKPSCKTEDAACWAKERRVDFEPMP
jgi:peptidoglycan-associated lipoprotein